jgi:hypothetical protein
LGIDRPALVSLSMARGAAMNGHRSCGLVRGVLGVLGRGRVVSSCVVWGVPAVVDTGLCDNSGFRVMWEVTPVLVSK